MRDKLIESAINAAKNSVSPYSGFKVGAALLCDDRSIYCGCNIENASYSATVCAERVAFFKALSDGKRSFSAIVIVGGRETVGETACPPCGVCRQVMSEFCDHDSFEVILPYKNGTQVYKLSELFPLPFGDVNL